MKLPVPGEVVASRYEVEALIKTGGQSIVFRGRDLSTRSQVALKLMQDHPGSDPEQFEREYHVLKEPGPGLPLARFLGQYEGTSLIVEDWVEGESLDDLPLPIDPNLAERIAREVLATLQHLHERSPPVVVRDIKPANLILSGQGVFLIDLSASRFVTGNPDTMPLGSPGFAAPEQYVGRSEIRSDLYATGTLLFHLLTGRDPLTETAPFSIRRYRPQVRTAMERMIQRATEPDPSDRQASAAEMLADLTGTAALPPAPARQTASPPGVSLPPASSRPRASPPVGAPGASPPPSRRFSLVWAVVVLVIGVALLGLWKDQRRLARELNLPAPPPRPASQSPSPSLVQPLPESASAQAYFDRGTHLLADSNPLGFYYLAAACRLDPQRAPYRRELEERLARFPRLRLAIPLEHRLKEPDTDAATRGDGQLKTPPALSNDGRWLACDFNGTLLDLRTGDRRRLNSYVSSLAFLPSERALVLGSELRLLELASDQPPGPTFELPRGHRVRLICPVGQDRLLILSASPGTHHRRTLQLYSLSDGQPVGDPVEDIAFYRASADFKRLLLYRCPQPREGKTTSFPQGSIEHWDLTDWKQVSSLPLEDEYILVGLDAGSLRAVLVKSWIRISILDLADGSELYPTTSSQKFSRAKLVVSRMTNDGHWFAWEFGEPPQAAQWWHVPSARALPAGRKILATDFGGQFALYRGQGQLGIWEASTGRDHGLALNWSGERAQFGADGLLLLPSQDRVQLVNPQAGTLADWSATGGHWSHLPPAGSQLLVATEQKSLLVWDLVPDQPLEPTQDPFWLVGSSLGLWPTSSQLTGLRYLEAGELSQPPELQRWMGPAESP